MAAMRLALFHAVLLALDAATLLFLRKQPRRWLDALLRWTYSTVISVGLGGWLVYPGESPAFSTIGLLAQLVFGHAPVVLALAAAVRGLPSRLRVALIGTSLVLVGIAADAFLLEPHRLEVTRYEIATPAVERRLRIVVLADLQTDAVTGYEREVVRRARELRPDLVLLPGDYVQLPEGDAYDATARALGRLVDTIHAPLGAYAVEGNVDPPTWPESVFGGTRVVATRRTTTVRVGPLALTSLSFEDSFDVGLALPREPGFHVVMGHGPDFALGRVEADLLVAGHTHGGQVQLPLIGPLMTLSEVPRRWAAGGLVELPRGRRLVVSRGLGMERGTAPRLRFLCQPELVVIDLVPAR